MDFAVGRDVGIGIFGRDGTGTVSAGVRLAQFNSRSSSTIGADPHVNFVTEVSQKYHNLYDIKETEERSFHGMGPEVMWDASQPVWGDPENGEIAIDWGVNAGILFGRQSVHTHSKTFYCHVPDIDFGQGHCTAPSTQTSSMTRSRRATVPDLGGYIGASMKYHNAKLSFGYRADHFFGAMDGGQTAAERYDRGFYGPYMNVTVGLGG